MKALICAQLYPQSCHLRGAKRRGQGQPDLGDAPSAARVIDAHPLQRPPRNLGDPPLDRALDAGPLVIDGPVGFDFLKCQTFAASPAEPGELLYWFSCSHTPEASA